MTIRNADRNSETGVKAYIEAEMISTAKQRPFDVCSKDLAKFRCPVILLHIA
jgi:hypothetical protein